MSGMCCSGGLHFQYLSGKCMGTMPRDLGTILVLISAFCEESNKPSFLIKSNVFLSYEIDASGIVTNEAPYK